jgi:hypothetical protein
VHQEDDDGAEDAEDEPDPHEGEVGLDAGLLGVAEVGVVGAAAEFVVAAGLVEEDGEVLWRES